MIDIRLLKTLPREELLVLVAMILRQEGLGHCPLTLRCRRCSSIFGQILCAQTEDKLYKTAAGITSILKISRGELLDYFI